MARESFDLLVIGGGIHGAAVARDAAGRGLTVLLAEKNDYASGTSSASSKLIHGGLRYLEQREFGLVRESLAERAELLKTAPHLVELLRFLVPIYRWQQRPAWLVHAGLKLYDLLSFGDGMPPSGKLSRAEQALLPRLRQQDLSSVLHYHDAKADDARLTLAVLLDARARGADIKNRRAVTGIAPAANGYGVELDERGVKRRIDARFVINAAGPWIGKVDAMSGVAPPERPLKLVRGSHIVLRMPEPPESDAYTLQDEEDRVVFVIPWLDRRFLMIGTTDVAHAGDPALARCSPAEQSYLLAAYNRYFAANATDADVVFTWSGVRALEDQAGETPSRISRGPALSAVANGSGGFVTLYGGKLTTHRRFAGDVLDALRKLGAAVGGGWTEDVPLFGGALSRAELSALAARGPATVREQTRRRWAFTYGDQTELLFDRITGKADLAQEIAPGVPRAELEYAAEVEDAETAEDFLLRRTKLHLTLSVAERACIVRWFGSEAA